MELAEAFVAEDAALVSARGRAAELGCVPVEPLAGAALRMLAAATGARTAVEVGTGTGVGTLYLLRGMHREGILTSIDIEPEHQRQARSTLREADIAPSRFRMINGRALEVLPRLADAGYDLVFIDADKPSTSGYIEEGLRLLRPGGLLVVDNALWQGKVADPAARDPQSVAIRQAVAAVAEDDRLLPALLPLADGLLTAVKR